MSAYYHDDIPTILFKRQRMQEMFSEHVQSILQTCANREKMEHIKRWTGRNSAQWIRHEVVNLCVASRSWAYDDGTDVFGFKADEHALAMRSALIVEMKIWLAALRQLTKRMD